MEDAAHGHEHQYFSHHADCPQHADQAATVAERLQMQGQKGVIRAVTEHHQRNAGVEHPHARPHQLLEKAARLRLCLRSRGQRLCIGHPPAAECDAGHDRQQDVRKQVQAEPFKHPPQHHDRQDEANRAP